jgi:hypothetical protein
LNGFPTALNARGVIADRIHFLGGSVELAQEQLPVL